MTELQYLSDLLTEVQEIRKEIRRIRHRSNDDHRDYIDHVYVYPDDMPETLTGTTYFRTLKGIKTIPCMVVDMREANYEFSCKIPEVPGVYHQFCLTHDSITDKMKKKAASDEPKSWTAWTTGSGKAPFSFSAPNPFPWTPDYSGFAPAYTVMNSEGKVRRFTKEDIEAIENSLTKANKKLPVKLGSYDEVYLQKLIALYEEYIDNIADDLLNNKEE